VAGSRVLYRLGAPVVALLVAAPIAAPQYPYPQYPPGTYPPGTYPPTQYPYPDDRVRLPGGVPVEVPTIKLPKRNPKDPKDKNAPAAENLKMTLRGVDGTLRELGEKDLYLEVGSGPKRLLRFRVLAKSQFRNKEGQPIRDSLLKAGDQLTLQVNVDDPETALRVILTRPGTDAERTAAGRPFDHDSAKAPVEADTRAVGTIELADSGAEMGAAAGGSAAEMDPGRPRIERRPEGVPNSAGSETVDATPQYTVEGRGSADEIIAAAQMAAASFATEIPNFLVQQYTTRYYSESMPAQWRVRDVVSAEVASVNGVEEYRNIQLNGRPSSAPPERTGAWSTGEFVTTLQDIMSPGVASFVRTGQDQIAGRMAYVYRYNVAKANSHWRLVAPRENMSEKPPYAGTIWIDKERRCVLRIQQQATGISSSFPYDRAESLLEYDYVRIDGKPYLLPILSENLMCQRGTASCSKNEIAFRNYRKFTAESNVTFGNLVPIRY
jgi:hypothetical protein